MTFEIRQFGGKDMQNSCFGWPNFNDYTVIYGSKLLQNCNNSTAIG